MTDTIKKYSHNDPEYYREYRRKKDGKPDYTDADMEECQLCHVKFVFLGAHVRQTHKMLMEDYKKEYGLDRKRGRSHGQFRELKAKRVFENKTVENLKAGKAYWFVPGSKTAGRYLRTQETKTRLKLQGSKIGKQFGGDHSE